MATKILYRKIAEDLKAQISLRQLSPNDQLPTEHELAEQYGVSRITSKRALSELEKEGLIYRIQGKGSFVSDNRITESSFKHILLLVPLPDRMSLDIYAQAITDFLYQKPYHLSLQSDTILEKESCEYFYTNYDGIILYPPTSNAYLDVLYSLYLRKFPVVLVDKKIDGLNFTTVTPDNFNGGYQACKHLIELGHTKILFLTKGLQYSSSIRERHFGYAEALNDAGIDFRAISIFSVDNGAEQELEQYFKETIDKILQNNITGIVAENDVTVVQFLNIARRYNYLAPNNFSIVGFDDLPISSLFAPSITTVAQDFKKIGYIAIDSLVRLIYENTDFVEDTVVPVKLVERESSRGV